MDVVDRNATSNLRLGDRRPDHFGYNDGFGLRHLPEVWQESMALAAPNHTLRVLRRDGRSCGLGMARQHSF
jgi:hypothetical protein